MMNSKKLAYLTAISALLLGGCAKELPYETLYKEQEKIFAKTEAISAQTGVQALPCTDKNDPCVYVPSNVESARYIQTGTIPFHMGMTKMVQFRIEGDKVRIVDLEKEKDFTANSTNDSLAISFPATHKDFRCATDANGNCTNKEEEISDVADADKKFVEVDFSGMQVHELNSFDEMTSSLWGCASEVDKRVKSLKVDNGSLNIIMERDFKYGLVCLVSGEVEDIYRESTFTVQHHYSFVPLSKIASKDYTPVSYTDFDEDKFGFFKTETSKLSVDHHDEHKNHEYFLNRWNPNKDEVVYYLNDSFYKKKYKSILNATETAVQNMNTTLKNAGVKLRIKLENGKGKDTGDIRNNFIVLVEDPQSSGILGYAPTSKNPLTGEILHGRAMMYHGTIEKFVSSAYIELYHSLKDQVQTSQDDASSDNGSSAQKIVESEVQKHKKALTLQQLVETLRTKDKRSNGKNLNSTLTQIPAGKLTNLALGGLGNSKFDLRDYANMNVEKFMGLKSDMKFKDNRFKFEDKEALRMYDFYATNNAYHGDLFNFSGVMTGVLNDNKLEKFKLADGTLIAWNDLDQDQRQEIIDIVMPFVWVPTLVHELGHTLGLRHNFYGSVDRANWYTRDELAAIGIKSDIPLSSVMDYPGTQVHELPVMGKYDIAALRFAYNREVEVADGSLLKVKDIDAEGKAIKRPLETAVIHSQAEMKEYMYCSDEHVAGSPLCNRHDLGTSYVEIAKYYIDQYNKRYYRANSRNDRNNFSAGDDMSYASGVNYYMRELRGFFELYDNIKNMFGATDEDIDEAIAQATDGEMDWLKEIRDAMELSADFFIDQIATPDVTCALQRVDGQMAVVPLKQIASNQGKSVTTCFDVKNLRLPKIPGTQSPMYTVVAETGKNMNNKKDSRSTHHMTSYVDQIDVRGTWMDKVFATNYLSRRKLGSIYDSSTGNYLDIKKIRAKVFAKLNEFAMNNVKTKAIFRDEKGNKVTDAVDLTFSIDLTHKINGSIFGDVNKFFGLTRGDDNNLLMRNILSEIDNTIVSEQDRRSTQELASMFRVYKTSSLTNIDENKFMTVEIGDTVFAAGEKNVLAQNAMTMIQINAILGKLDEETIKKIIASRDQVTPADADEILTQTTNDNNQSQNAGDDLPKTPEVEAAKKLPTQILEMYLSGEIPETNHLEEVLFSLPQA